MFMRKGSEVNFEEVICWQYFYSWSDKFFIFEWGLGWDVIVFIIEINIEF